jgi:hypothetical protein
MVKPKINLKTNNGLGGIMGSGIFGMFGSTVHCDANNNSFYCSITKLVNLIIMFFFLACIVYLIYLFMFDRSTKGKIGRKR